MRTSEWGVRQLGQAVVDHAAERSIRAVGADGVPVVLDDGEGDQVVTDNWLRRTFPPPGRPVAPAAPETAHEKYLDAMAKLGDAMDGVGRAVRRFTTVEGVDGRPLVSTEGVDPSHADAWLEDLMKLLQLVPVWKAVHVARHGSNSPGPTSGWGETDGYDPTGDDPLDDDDPSTDGWDDQS
jgi:hypothetical protein